MKRPTPNRIPTGNAPLPGLHNPFASLPSDSLPPGPAASAPTPVDPGWKMGRVILQRETAHRGGKTVIVIHDFATHLPDSILERLARKLRSACGCGGTMKDRRIEIQGDQPFKIRTLLESEGFQVGGVR